MDIKKIKEVIELAKESGLVEFKYEGDDEKFSFKLPGSGQVVLANNIAPQAQVSNLGTPVQEVKQVQNKKVEGVIEVTSPFVGTYYSSSSPGADSYVSVGSKISSGQVLCIVEAMKIMNEIESDVSGEIVEICVENETYVEFGQVLFRVKK